MTDIADAQPGDLYIDANGKLWRILEVVREPTVTAEEVEGTLWDPNAPMQLGAPQIRGAVLVQGMIAPMAASINKAKWIKTTADACWVGFTRIWRKPAP